MPLCHATLRITNLLYRTDSDASFKLFLIRRPGASISDPITTLQSPKGRPVRKADKRRGRLRKCARPGKDAARGSVDSVGVDVKPLAVRAGRLPLAQVAPLNLQPLPRFIPDAIVPASLSQQTRLVSTAASLRPGRTAAARAYQRRWEVGGCGEMLTRYRERRAKSCLQSHP